MEPNSDIIKFVVEAAEWRAKFATEREWKEQLQKEKSELEEKYTQLAFELGSQKKMVQQLEDKVNLLLSSGVPAAEEPADSPDENDVEAVSEMEEERASHDDLPEYVPHHVYTNVKVYEPVKIVLTDIKNGPKDDEPLFLHRRSETA